MHRRLAVILVLLGVLGLTVGPASAQLSLSIKPAQLLVDGQQGRSLTRTLLVQSGAPFDGVQLIVADLIDDRGNVLRPMLGSGAPPMRSANRHLSFQCHSQPALPEPGAKKRSGAFEIAFGFLLVSFYPTGFEC